MSASGKAGEHLSRIRGYTWILAAVWTIITATSLVWNMIQIKSNTSEEARIQARAAHGKDVTYRLWNALHGGVYVPVTDVIKPNPYLANIPERDITTPSGKLLTLINPAYMTRQVHETAEQKYGIRGHITSLDPIRPENAPDPWEVNALQAFERGDTENSSIEDIEGEEYMRLMRPLITEESCLKCHAAQGYQEGDVRGGISVSIPMAPLKAVASQTMLTFGLGHVLLWLIGLGGIVLGTQRFKRTELDRRLALEALEQVKNELEIIVEERTSELRIANEQLKRDITERKRAEEALKAQNEFITNLYESLTYPFYIVNASDHSIALANSAAKALAPTGLSTCYALAHKSEQPCDSADHPCPLEMARKSGQAVVVEHKHYDQAGNERIVEVHGYPILDRDGNVSQMIEYTLDITERKGVEEELGKHREHLESLVVERTKELKKIVNAMAGREVRMAELKDIDKQLRKQLKEAGMTPVA